VNSRVLVFLFFIKFKLTPGGGEKEKGGKGGGGESPFSVFDGRGGGGAHRPAKRKFLQERITSTSLL